MTSPSGLTLSTSELEFHRTRSQFAEALIQWEDEPFSLRDYPMFRAIYDGSPEKMLLKTCRQVGKSMTLSSFSIAESAVIPHFATFFIAPTKEQTLTFSTSRVGKMIQFSPIVRDLFVNANTEERVLARHFSHGSKIVFSYASDNADRCRGQSCDRLCFDERAEVLTRDGWVPVKELTLEHEVADVNATGTVEWHHPSDLVRQKYTGDLVRFRHRGIDLRVTEDHWMWANYALKKGYKTPDQWRFVRAYELADTSRMGFKFANAAKWLRSPFEETIVLPGVEGTYGKNARPLSLDARDFAELVGWYLSEGSIQWKYWKGERKYPRIVLTQNVGKHAARIEALLKRLGLTFSFSERQNMSIVDGHQETCRTYFINAPQLGQYFVPLGLSRDKYIPETYFEHPELLERVLEAVYLGDGMFHPGQRWDQSVLRTRSRRLADGTHRAWTVLGRAAIIYTTPVPPRFGDPEEPMYEVAAHKLDYSVFWRSEFVTKERVSREPVRDETVYCLTVPNHRPIVRGGFGQKPVVTGQCIDEIQDVLLEVVRPVVVECLRQSKRGPFETYCGTPKTMENGIETLWEASSQTEWVIKCSGCGKHSCIVSEKQLGKHGPICKCGKYLNPRDGFWFNMNQRADVEMRGFHISRPMMPTDVPICWNAGTKEYERAVKKWRSILSSLSGPTAVPISMFRNEILGVSDSAGRRLVTKEILNRMRTGPAISVKPTRENRTSVTKVIAGIDWSGGGDGLKSRTVLTILGKMGLGKTRLLYYKIFPGTSPVEEIEEIISVLQEYDRITDHTMIIGADAGEGNMSVDILRNRLPNPRRIVKFRYSGNYGGYIGWHPKTSTFVVNRTAAIDSLMMSFINGEFEFPKEPEDVMKGAFDDILSVYEEESGQGDVRRKVWRHKKPDDFLHALNFGRLAMQISIGEIDMTSKIIYDDSELDAIGPHA